MTKEPFAMGVNHMMTLPPGMEMLAERIAASPRCTVKYKLGGGVPAPSSQFYS